MKLLNYHLQSVLTAQSCCSTSGMKRKEKKKKKVTLISKMIFREMKGIADQEA